MQEFREEIDRLKKVICQREEEFKEFKLSAWVTEKGLREDVEEANSVKYLDN